MITKKAKKKASVWWEKTVEYKFITDCVSSGIFKTICPLDGNEEILGDAIASINVDDAFDEEDNMFIVEFKRTFERGCLKQETDKFLPKKNAEGYVKAKNCFGNSKFSTVNKSHFLIAAAIYDDKFELICRDYFFFQDEHKKTLEECFNENSGMDLKTFISYASCFSSHKKHSFCYYCDSNSGKGEVTKPKGSDPNGGNKPKEESNQEGTTYIIGINPISKECKIVPFELLRLFGPDNDGNTTGSPIINIPGASVVSITYEDIDVMAKSWRSHEKEING